jgi:histidinol-phosphate aminotransferase
MPAKELYQALLKRGILVRNVSSLPLLSKALRVSVGTEAENAVFLNALRDIVRQ